MPTPETLFMALILGLVLLFTTAFARAGRSDDKGLLWGVAAFIVLIGWLALLEWAARSGWTARRGVLPPPPLRLLAFAMVLVGLVAVSPLGEFFARGLGLAALVAYQAFRAPLEWMLHHWAQEGLAPLAMTYAGRNFDLAIAVSALPVAWILYRKPSWRLLLHLWNAAGLISLANILSIAVPALPTYWTHPRGTPNSLLFHWPQIWIVFCVQAALLGHLAVWRAPQDAATDTERR